MISRFNPMNSLISYTVLEKEVYHDSPVDIPGFVFVVDLKAYMIEQYKKPFRTDYFYLMLVTKGSVTMTIEAREHTVKKNGLLLCAPSSIRQLGKIAKGTRISSIGFTAEYMHQIGFKDGDALLTFFSGISAPHWQLNEEDTQRLNHIMKEIERHLYLPSGYPYKRELLTHSFNVLLYELAGLGIRYKKAATGAISRKEVMIQNFIQKVKSNYFTMRTVKEYANELSVTPKYLTEATKEITGKNARSIIDEYILNEIKHRLTQIDLTISEIAAQLNFPDLSAFGKFFKRLTGVSVSRYRENLGLYVTQV